MLDLIVILKNTFIKKELYYSLGEVVGQFCPFLELTLFTVTG